MPPADSTTPLPTQDCQHPSIRVLPDRVVNQIAAGEVIERPAAVVKELVENSLDAGATRIEVEFRQGGKSFIRVEDNGRGMSPDEALLSLERHATSKLREADDLLSIVSLGFRGEALPSIASVSRFTMKTRTAEWEHGSEIFINGGKMIHQRDCGMAPGTRMEVAQLFNSVPARRKFLKTDATEAAHIIQLVRLHAVSRPDVAFELIENGRTVFKSPVCPTKKDRVLEIWGSALAKELVELPAIETSGLKLQGLIGKPGVARASRREMITLVNGRPVDSRTLNFALIEAYHTFIPKGKYPLAFLFLNISPDAVDVNIHPAKREIRFRDEGRVRQFILRAVQEELRKHSAPQWQPAIPESKPPLPSDEASQAAEAILQARAPVPQPRPLVDLPAEPTPAFEAKPVEPDSVMQANEIKPPPLIEEKGSQIIDDSLSTTPATLDWRLIGRWREQTALFETETGLIMMNVRAAHQRVWFERIEKGFAEEAVVQQPLLVPIPLEFEPVASAILEEHLEFFQKMGFQLEPFGRHFFRLEAYPEWVSEKSVESFVRELVATIREQGLNPQKTSVAHESIARLAATRAVRMDDSLNDEAVIALANDLLACSQPLACPQGRPTYFEMTRGELDKRFGKSR